MHYFKADNAQNVNAILSPNLRHSWKSMPILSPRQEGQEILINTQARVPFASFSALGVAIQTEKISSFAQKKHFP